MPNGKKILFCIVVCLLFFLSGFFARGILDGRGVSNAIEYHQAIENELGKADLFDSGIESGITGARDGIEKGLERTGIIGNGLDGIEKYAVENTSLLDGALRILRNAGERKQKPLAE
jgi:hypothetical protein